MIYRFYLHLKFVVRRTEKILQIATYNYNAAGNVVRKESYIKGEEYTTGKTIEETVYDENGNAVKSFTYNSLDTSSKFYTESSGSIRTSTGGYCRRNTTVRRSWYTRTKRTK